MNDENMNDQEINIAIAEACGWHDCSFIDGESSGLREDITSLNGRYESLPDYCNDLNAMHEAEKKLIFSERKLFRYWLQKVKGSEVGDGVEIALDECVHASARQRAEAFLRVFDKWKEAAK